MSDILTFIIDNEQNILRLFKHSETVGQITELILQYRYRILSYLDIYQVNVYPNEYQTLLSEQYLFNIDGQILISHIRQIRISPYWDEFVTYFTQFSHPTELSTIKTLLYQI